LRFLNSASHFLCSIKSGMLIRLVAAKEAEVNHRANVAICCDGRPMEIVTRSIVKHSRTERRFFFRAALLLGLTSCLLAGGARAAIVHQYLISDTQFGSASQTYVCGDPAADYACGPTAVANAFAYLENTRSGEGSLIPALKKPDDINNDGLINRIDDIVGTAADLCMQFMDTLADFGTSWFKLIAGTQDYLNTRPVNYTMDAQGYWQWPGSWTGTVPYEAKPAFVSDQTKPSWLFLLDGLKAGDGVEILFQKLDANHGANHYVTLTGLYFLDKNLNDVIDITSPGDPNFDPDVAYITYMDPVTGAAGTSDLWMTNGFLVTDYSGGSWIGAALAQGIPEPGTLSLLALALLTLVGTRLAAAQDRRH
jgi:hypothetical protein